MLRICPGAPLFNLVYQVENFEDLPSEFQQLSKYSSKTDKLKELCLE